MQASGSVHPPYMHPPSSALASALKFAASSSRHPQTTLVSKVTSRRKSFSLSPCGKTWTRMEPLRWPSVVSWASNTRCAGPAMVLVAVQGITVQPDPFSLSSTNPSPEPNTLSHPEAKSMVTPSSPAEAEEGPSSPMVTQLSKASSGNKPIQAGEMPSGLLLPNAFW